ncbi:hypothetical protein D3Z50_07265 [Clostridiaceae bacterium]|nr:hypothetical protein [Clostridiaceae bacterium]
MKDLKSLRSTLTGPVSLGILSRERSLLMGMAMAWVVFFHMTIWISGDWPVLSFIKGMGNIGVDMFLILSGAGLYHSYQTLSEQGLGFKEFYRKRFWRIAPAVVICLLPWFTYQQFTAPSSFARYLMDITSLSFWRDGRNPGWYAAFSIVLYALYPLIFASIRPGDARRNISAFLAWGGVFVLFSYIIKWYDPVYYWQIELALSRFPVFFFGCFIAPEIERGREVSGWFLLALYVASGVLIAWMAGSPEGIGGVYEFTRYAYCPVAFGLLMLSARLLSAASGASALRPVRAGLGFAGQHTLEIYLLHTQILSVCSRFLLPLPGIQGLKRADVWVNLAALLLTLAGAGAVKALERTVLRLKERMEPDAPRENPDAGIAFVRAAAAAMIIACHMLQFYGNALAYWLNVGVEVFLIISGVLYGQRDISAPFGWIRRQWRKVLVPYWVFCLAAVFAYAVFANEYVTLYGCAGLLLACKRFPGLGHLWFIPYILLLYLMTPLLQWTYDEYLSERPDREVAVWLMLLTGVLWLLRYYGIEDFAENRLVCYYGGYVLGRRFFRGKKEGERNPALEKWMNRAGAAALVTAAARGFIQYHALEEAVPYWSYVLPFIHSLMGFGVFWALYRAAGWSGLGKSRCVRLADRYSFEMYLTHHIFILGAGRLHCMEVFSHPACNVLLVLAFTAASAWLLHFAARAAKRPPERNFKTRSETPERTQEQAQERRAKKRAPVLEKMSCAVRQAHAFIQYLS